MTADISSERLIREYVKGKVKRIADNAIRRNRSEQRSLLVKVPPPNLSQLNPDLSQLNPNLSQLNPEPVMT